MLTHQSLVGTLVKCSHEANFCQQIIDLLKQGQIINYWQYDKHNFRKVVKFVEICHLVYTLVLNWGKFRAHKLLFTAFGTIASRKFRHMLISQNVWETLKYTACTAKFCTILLLTPYILVVPAVHVDIAI